MAKWGIKTNIAYFLGSEWEARAGKEGFGRQKWEGNGENAYFLGS